MFRTASLLILLILASCRTTSPCSFSPQLAGWKLAAVVPPQLTDKSEKSSRWYVNERREYMLCMNSKSEDVCGGIYETYSEISGKYTRSDFIVCME